MRAKRTWRFLQGASPCWGRTNHPPIPSIAIVRKVVQEVRTGPNEAIEAYTGNHVARREDRTSQSLVQPRQSNEAGGDGVNGPEANTKSAEKRVSARRACRGPQGVGCVERNVRNLGDPGGSWVLQVSGASAQEKRIVCHKRGNPETEVGRTLNADEQTRTSRRPGRLSHPKRRRDAESCQGVRPAHSTLRR